MEEQMQNLYMSGENERENLYQEINTLEDIIHEQKNTIERQEILIDKLKCCGNCKFTGPGEDFGSPCNNCKNRPEWDLFDE